MLATVMPLLANEAAYLLKQERILDLFPEQSDRMNEKALTLGKQYRHGIKEMALERVAAVPMTWHGVRKSRFQMAGVDFKTFRGSTDHCKLT
jgi:hypothetical protein